MGLLTIGQLARRAGIGVEAIRFYEKQGLLPAPARLPSGYRQYSADAAERIRFIRRAQRLGFALREVKELLALRDDPNAHREEVRERAAAKLADIDARLADLQAMRGELGRLVETSRSDGPATACPILADLRGNGANA